MSSSAGEFDPRAILSALEADYVDYVLIGGLAQVLRGVDIVTRGVDICPSFGRGNLDRLTSALGELGARSGRRAAGAITADRLRESVVRLGTSAGDLGVVGSPAGVPNGFVDLRRAATREDLGAGVRPLVASSGDLAAMAAALHRPKDLERLSTLRRIVELEVIRQPAAGRAPSARPARTRRPGRAISP